MATQYCIDFRLKQILAGAVCETGWSYRTDRTTTWSLGDLIVATDYFVANFLGLVNAVQPDTCTNVQVTAQARGGAATPTYFEPVGGGGAVGSSGVAQMPPEFAYWLRFGVNVTKDSQDNAITDKPIKRGGAFIPGCLDSYLEDSIFSIPSAYATYWNALGTYLQTDHDAGAFNMQPVVLAEQLGSSVGFRFAAIEAAIPVRITRLRSRLAIG